MAEPIKIPEEDLKKIQDIQIQYQKKIEDFGKLYLEKMSIDTAIQMIADKEASTQKEWKELQERENALIEDFLKRYGEGNLDLKQGTFTPAT